MNRVINYLKNYIGVISIVLALCILLTYSLSYFKVNTESKRAAEMYIGELKYTISIDGTSTNTLTVPSGETIVDIDLTNQNEIKTYYKLLYLNNSNISISYFNQTKNTSEEVTSYKSPSDVVESKSQNSLKLKIINNSSSNQTLTFKVSGGYSTNTLADVEVPNTYTEITSLETPSTNTYFCKTNETLTQGLEYVDGQYTYAYKKEGRYSSSGLAWTNIYSNGWGVQLTDKTSTDPVTSKVCTYINNKPLLSTCRMFDYSRPTTIDIGSFDTSNVTNMSYMFYNSNATTINGVENFDTSSVTNMYGLFWSSQTTTIDVGNFDTNKVTNMSYMFYNSKAITLDVSHFETGNVTNMSSMFGNSKVTTLDVSGFDTSKVTDMSYMFYNIQTTTLDVSNFNTSKVNDMSYMFAWSKATSLILSNFDTSSVTNMSNMFYANKATTLDVSSFDTSNVTDMSNMFMASEVATINLSGFNTSKVTRMDYMFYSSKATSIKGLDKFNTSKVTDMSGMFSDIQVTTLDLSSFDTSKVTNMSYMFKNSKVTTLDLKNFDTSKVTDMSNMFSTMNITTLDLSSFDTSKVTDMSNMFQNDINLSTIYVSNKFVTTNVTSSDKMFLNTLKLIGGSETKYNSSYIDKTYARIDGGTSSPGYFTDIDIQAPNSFSTDTWKTIIKAVKNNNISKYNVGDTKEVDMGTYGVHTLRIANTSTPSECNKTGFSQTACGFVLEFADVITTHYMNPAGEYNGTQYDYGYNVGGWPNTSMRTFVNNYIYNSLPSNLKNGIIDTIVVSGHGSSDSSNFTSTDKLYLLAPKEIYSDWNNSNDTAKDSTRQLDYYKKEGVTTSSYSKAIKMYNSSASYWWLRFADSTDDYTFYYIYNIGRWFRDSTGVEAGVSPAFRIG